MPSTFLKSMQKADLEQKATALLQQYGYDFAIDDYINIVDFARKYGFTLVKARLSSNKDGFLAIRSGVPGKIIGVNARRSVEEKRFIIARNFARSILQYTDEKIVLHRENGLTAEEKVDDANYLAGALLMPAASLKREYLRLKSLNVPENIIYLKLSEKYKVSAEQMLRRFSAISFAPTDETNV